MKCTNCGAELPDGSTVCFECGAPQQTQSASEAAPSYPHHSSAAHSVSVAGKVQNKCRNCGADLPEGTTVCFECGAPQNVAKPKSQNNSGKAASGTGETKSKFLAAILAFFLGCYGIDQFYLGFVKTGIIRIVVSFVTCGLGGALWGVIDCIRIATGSIKEDSKGNPIV